MHFDYRARNALLQEVHHDPAAHRAGADDADLFDLAQLRVLGQAVDLGRLTLGEEDVPLCRRLAAEHQLHELLALEGEAFVEGQARRRLDAGEVGIGRLEPAPALGILGLELFDHRNVAEYRTFARRARAVGDLGAGEGDRIGGKAVLARQFVNEA